MYHNIENDNDTVQLSDTERLQLRRIETRLFSTRSDVLARIDQTGQQIAQLTSALAARNNVSAAASLRAGVPTRKHVPLSATRSATTQADEYVASFTQHYRGRSPTASLNHRLRAAPSRSANASEHDGNRLSSTAVPLPAVPRPRQSMSAIHMYRSRPQSTVHGLHAERSVIPGTSDNHQDFRSKFYNRLIPPHSAEPHSRRRQPSIASLNIASRPYQPPNLRISQPPSPTPSNTPRNLTVREGAQVHMLRLPPSTPNRFGADNTTHSSFRLPSLSRNSSLVQLHVPAGHFSAAGAATDHEVITADRPLANADEVGAYYAQTSPRNFKFSTIAEQSYRSSTVHDSINVAIERSPSGSCTTSITDDAEILRTEQVAAACPQRRVQLNRADELELIRLRTKLQDFFSDPLRKFAVKRRVIIRPLIQLVKMFLVTAQLFVFSDLRFPHIDFVLNNRLALGKLLLNESFSVATDKYLATDRLSSDYFYGIAVETQDEFYEIASQALIMYYNIEELSIGSYYNRNLRTAKGKPGGRYDVVYCVTSYRRARFYPDERLFRLDAKTLTSCASPILPATLPLVPSAHERRELHAAVSLATFGFIDPHIGHMAQIVKPNSTNITDSGFSGGISPEEVKDFLPDRDGDYDDDEDPIQAYFDRLIRATLSFRIDTVHVWDMERYNVPPICYALNATIIFDNSGHFGRVMVDFDLQEHRLPARDCGDWPENAPNTVIVINYVLHVLVLIITSLSLMLCMRSLYNGNRFRLHTQRMLYDKLGYVLTTSEKVEFLGKWTGLVAISDSIILSATLYRVLTSVHDPDTDANSILLGIGNLLVWIGALRYLSFFNTYNVLLLTIKKSMPSVLRYCVCAVIIYVGFSLCGWLAFGPYHPKFRSWSAACEALFSVANGDDINNCFAVLGDQVSLPLWIFFRIYLYLYISLFTYVVLNVFLSLILDAYGVIKDYDSGGVPLTILQGFVVEGAVPDAVDLPERST